MATATPWAHGRWSRTMTDAKPKAGDGVLWPDGSMGRVSDGPNQGYAEHDEVHVCFEQGSAFTADGGDTLSVSGGPFHIVKLRDLAPTGETYTAWFWRWG